MWKNALPWNVPGPKGTRYEVLALHILMNIHQVIDQSKVGLRELPESARRMEMEIREGKSCSTLPIADHFFKLWRPQKIRTLGSP